MTVELQDILKVNLVLVGLRVLETEAEIQAFQIGAGAEVATRPLPVPDPPLVLALERERIALETSAQRTVVQQSYPDVADFGRIARIATLAFESTAGISQDLTVVHGYNIDAVFRQVSGLDSLAYLAQRLFDPVLSRKLGWDLAGGTGNLSFVESTGRRWSFNVEPRAFDMQTGIFVSTNSEVTQPIPSQDEIERALHDCWEQTKRFIAVLDEEREP